MSRFCCTAGDAYIASFIDGTITSAVGSSGGRTLCYAIAKPSSQATQPTGRPRDPAVRTAILAAGEATGRYKALAQELRTNSGLSQEFASQAVNLAQAFALDTKQIDAVAEAALVMSERFGGTFAERFLQFGLGAKGNAEALEELSKALNLAVEASDVEKVVRNLSAIARLQKEIDFLNVRQSGLFNLAGAGGQGGEQTALEIQRRLNSIRQIEEQTRIRTTAAAEAERKAVEAETEAFFEQFVEIERLNRARKEMRDLQEKGDIAAIQMEVDAKARALDGRRMGFGDGQAGQAFADANEEARQAISTYSLVRDGIDLAANSFIGLGQAAVQGSKAIKQAAISIVADVAGMIARFLALSAFSAIFGGFAPAGGAYRPSLGLEPTPRARGGYKGAGSRVKSFAGGTPFSGVTDGEMYLVGDNSNGREAVIPLPDGRRVPVEMRGGGGNTVINNYHVQTIDSQSFESWVLRSKGAVANAVMAELDERPSFRHSIRGT